MCRDDLPTLASAHPGIGKPVAATERALGPVAANHQPSRDDGRRAETMDLHILVMRRVDRVWSRNDIAQDVIAACRAIVFSVNEAVCQQAPKQRDIAARQPESPIVLEPEQHLCLGIRALGARARSLCGEQQRDEQQVRNYGSTRCTFPFLLLNFKNVLSPRASI